MKQIINKTNVIDEVKNVVDDGTVYSSRTGSSASDSVGIEEDIDELMIFCSFSRRLAKKD